MVLLLQNVANTFKLKGELKVMTENPSSPIEETLAVDTVLEDVFPVLCEQAAQGEAVCW